MSSETFKQKLILNGKLAIGPGVVALEKWGAHAGATAWARGQAFARGTESEGFQKALGAMVETEVDLQTYFGFKTWEQLAMRGGQAILLGFAMYAENRQLPANWHLDKMPKPVKYVAETARALYFASLVAAPVILDKIINGEPVEPVSAGLVLGTAGAGLLYSWLRVMAANNIETRELRIGNREKLRDPGISDWDHNYTISEWFKWLSQFTQENEQLRKGMDDSIKAVFEEEKRIILESGNPVIIADLKLAQSRARMIHRPDRRAWLKLPQKK